MFKKIFFIRTFLSKLTFFFFLISNAGCALWDSEAKTPLPSFQFDPSQKDALVAFSIDCADLGTVPGNLQFYSVNDKHVIDGDGYSVPISCTSDVHDSQVYAYIFSPGNYGLTLLRIGIGRGRFYENYHFYFPVQAHKVNYLGHFRFAYLDKKTVEIGVYNEKISDVPIVRSIVPEVSSKDYVFLSWEKNGLGDFIAK